MPNLQKQPLTDQTPTDRSNANLQTKATQRDLGRGGIKAQAMYSNADRKTNVVGRPQMEQNVPGEDRKSAAAGLKNQ